MDEFAEVAFPCCDGEKNVISSKASATSGTSSSTSSSIASSTSFDAASESAKLRFKK